MSAHTRELAVFRQWPRCRLPFNVQGAAPSRGGGECTARLGSSSDSPPNCGCGGVTSRKRHTPTEICQAQWIAEPHDDLMACGVVQWN